MGSIRSGRSGAGIALGLVMVVWTVPGCSADFSPSMLDLNGHGLEIDPEMVLIGFQNRTPAEAVNVEFYATNAPLAVLPDDLFVEGNLVTASIGTAGTGILEAGKTDWIEFPCTEDLTIGTRGGTFLDNESGEERGVGISRHAREGPLALCGSLVTFEFAWDGERFTTTLNVGD